MLAIFRSAIAFLRAPKRVGRVMVCAGVEPSRWAVLAPVPEEATPESKGMEVKQISKQEAADRVEQSRRLKIEE